MLIVLILLGIILLLLLLVILIVLSTLRIEIEDFRADNYKRNEHIVKEYFIFIRLYLFNKLKWFGIKIDKAKVLKIKKGSLLKYIDNKMGIKRGEELNTLEKLIIKKRKELFNKETLKDVKGLKIYISKLNFKLDIGTVSTVLTPFVVVFISSVLSILLTNGIENLEYSKCNYKITPLYMERNIFKIKVNCIINIKIVHIMNIIYFLAKKRRSDNEDGRTSDRRSHVYSHE